MTEHVLTTFKAISLIFALAAVVTGVQAVYRPAAFSRSFGLAITDVPHIQDLRQATATKAERQRQQSISLSYVSLMGVRQLSTGLILLVFAYRDKWTEMAVILVVIGILVAGTDAIHLKRAGAPGLALFHAVPAATIAGLSAIVLYLDN